MPDATFNFPRGFLWGTATAAHQVEGNNKNNNWYAFEQEEGRIAEGHKSGLACDWWGGRWREDFDRAAETGQNALRLSIEWSRIQPKPDMWDEDALDHYRQMMQGLLDRGLFPLVTLHHFTDPLWVTEMGGWENAEIVPLFEAYTEKVVGALKGYVSTWCTINEPNVVAVMGSLLGEFPPGKNDLGTTFAAMENMARAHAASYHKIKELQPESRVGMAINYRGFLPGRPGFPPDRMLANMLHKLYNNFFADASAEGVLRFIGKQVKLPQAKGTMDYMGVNYYTCDEVRFDLRAKDVLFTRRGLAPGFEASPNGMLTNQPEGFFGALKWALGYNLPIIVTENGTEDDQDDFRRRYLIEHIHQMWRAVNFNYPIKGYFQWSLVDNFEWAEGWTKRFGLWELDIETQARRKRRSADMYAAICQQNALSSAIVREFAPELVEKLFPG